MHSRAFYLYSSLLKIQVVFDILSGLKTQGLRWWTSHATGAEIQTMTSLTLFCPSEVSKIVQKIQETKSHATSLITSHSFEGALADS